MDNQNTLPFVTMLGLISGHHKMDQPMSNDNKYTVKKYKTSKKVKFNKFNMVKQNGFGHTNQRTY
jgi:hypothetical protein